MALDGVPVWCWLPALIGSALVLVTIWRSKPTWRELIRRYPLDKDETRR
jgi:hypothetical protein